MADMAIDELIDDRNAEKPFLIVWHLPESRQTHLRH